MRILTTWFVISVVFVDFSHVVNFKAVWTKFYTVDTFVRAKLF